MAFVSTELVFARRVGKEMIAVGWMRKLVNVFLIVQEMVVLILRHSNVSVMRTGSEMIALLDCVALIAVIMEGTIIKANKSLLT